MSTILSATGERVSLRGGLGRIDCLPLAWKAATCIGPDRASLANAFRTTGFDRTNETGLWMVGKHDVDFVDKVRFDAVARQVCLRIAGRAIEAMVNCYNRSFCSG
jgi:hypothetical protein